MMLSGCRVIDALDDASLAAVVQYSATLPELPAILREPINPQTIYVEPLAVGYNRMIDRLMRERRSALCVQR